MINVSSIRDAKLDVLARAARLRQRVVLKVVRKGTSTVIESRVFEPYNKVVTKNHVCYLGRDTVKKGLRQFDVDKILDVQLANGYNRFVKPVK